MAKGGVAAFGMFGLGFGYFLWYTPYSGLAKALSGGLVPGIDHPIGGLVLLPAAALGTLVAMPFFTFGSGWWRYSRRRRIGGITVPYPRRHTAEAAFWMALIMGSTTLIFTFPGASIVFMLVLTRIENLVVSPTWDLLRRRKIHWYSATALLLSLASAIIALTDVHNYVLTVGAVLSLAAYGIGYVFRFRIMSTHAKTGDVTRDRQYFIEEHMTTPVILVLLLLIPALIDKGAWPHALHVGFTSFLTSGAAFPAFLIGVCYEGLFIMTSLIYIDPREFSFGTPVSVCGALLAGIAASFGLHFVYDAPQPSVAQFFAAACVIAAAFVLSYPTVQGRLAARRQAARPARGLLFVCDGNTSRSPMAAAIARAELDRYPAGGNANGAAGWQVASAGVAVRRPGAPLAAEAATVLRELGIPVPEDHRAVALTPQMCTGIDAVYCMTEKQRDAVVALAPEAADRTFCLDTDADVPNPGGQSLEVYREVGLRLRTLVHRRLRELGAISVTPQGGLGAA